MNKKLDYAELEKRVKELEIEVKQKERLETAFKRLEHAFRRQSRILNIMTGQMEDMVYYKDKYFRYIFSSKPHCDKVLKCDQNECIGKTDFEIAPLHKPVIYEPGFGEILDSSDTRTKDSGKPMKFTEVANIDNQKVYLETYKTPIFNEKGEFSGIVGCSRDVTSRMMADKKIAEQQELLRCLVDSIPAEIYFKDRDLRYLAANKGFLKSHGIQANDVTGKIDFDIFPHEIAETIRNRDSRVLDSREPVINREEPVIDASGKNKWMMVSKIPYLDDEDNVAGIIGVAMNITDKKEAEAEVLRRDKILQAVFSAAEYLLKTPDWRDRANDVLEVLGKATEVSRVSIFENVTIAKGNVVMRRLASWINSSGDSQNVKPELKELSYRDAGFERWLETLSRGEIIFGDIRDFPSKERKILKFQGLRSVLITPVLLKNDLWGFMEFGESASERKWLSLEIDLLKAAADTLGTAIERKLSEDNLRRAKEAAEIADRAKNRFIAGMSHEFRTPMNAIIGMTDLALDTDLNEQQKGYLKKAGSSARSLLNILDNILTYSNIESGEIELQPEPFSILNIIRGLCARFAPRAWGKGVEIILNINEGSHDLVVGDPERLTQILENLIENAVKFTEQGEIVISTGCPERSMTCGTYRFSVKDTGIGVAETDKPHLFHSFSQVDASSTRKYGGTGLGLSLSKSLAELMGGEIQFESEAGRGSVFHVTIPFERQSPGAEQKPVVPGSLSGVKTLIVDDNATVLAFLKKTAEHYGLEPVSLTSSGDVIAEIEAAKDGGRGYDMLILDRTLPETDGLEFAKKIRNHPLLINLPIILLNHDGASDNLKMNPADRLIQVLDKPVVPSELLKALKRAVKSINEKGGAAQEVPESGISLDDSSRKMLMKAFHEIHSYLIEYDIEAENCLAALIKKLGGSSIADEFSELEKQISGYNFMEAVTTLKNISIHLGVPDPETPPDAFPH